MDGEDAIPADGPMAGGALTVRCECRGSDACGRHRPAVAAAGYGDPSALVGPVVWLHNDDTSGYGKAVARMVGHVVAGEMATLAVAPCAGTLPAALEAMEMGGRLVLVEEGLRVTPTRGGHADDLAIVRAYAREHGADLLVGVGRVWEVLDAVSGLAVAAGCQRGMPAGMRGRGPWSLLSVPGPVTLGGGDGRSAWQAPSAAPLDLRAMPVTCPADLASAIVVRFGARVPGAAEETSALTWQLVRQSDPSLPGGGMTLGGALPELARMVPGPSGSGGTLTAGRAALGDDLIRCGALAAGPWHWDPRRLVATSSGVRAAHGVRPVSKDQRMWRVTAAALPAAPKAGPRDGGHRRGHGLRVV